MHSSVNPDVLIIFAGGPHTASRLARAVALAQASPPATVYLTGCEFHDPEHGQAIHMLSRRARVALDDARRTVESCRVVSHQIHPRSTVRAITSNYHAPRVRWLLWSFLPKGTVFSVETTADLQAAELWRSSLARRLILGEIVSWLYCFPLGLLRAGLRPAGTGASA